MTTQQILEYERLKTRYASHLSGSKKYWTDEHTIRLNYLGKLYCQHLAKEIEERYQQKGYKFTRL